MTESRRAKLAAALASPIGVLITVPLLVMAVGVSILLVGRDATRSASQSMAQKQLTEQASSITADVAFALDQAAPILERLRVLADPSRPLEDVLVRIHDLIVGRPGVSYASISFPDGTFRGAYLGEQRRIEAQESRIAARGTEVKRFTVNGGAIVPLRDEITSYDPRKRSFYQLVQKTRTRTWTEPYTFFDSHETGITCTEPLYDAAGNLVAVLTVDFDVGALSTFVSRPALDEARTLVSTRDGVILAYPAADKLALPASDKLLRYTDLRDPSLDALYRKLAQPGFASALELVNLDASDGEYLASIAPIGGKRAGVDVPLDWYVATVVPERTLLGPTHALERSSVIASGGALTVAVGIALILAWNLVRMRRQVAASRAQAKKAEARARELGAYKLVARLGAGGMGEVWRAEHRLLARSAAIKLIRPEALADPDAVPEIRERFRREAQVLASMKSRHTIGLFDYGVTDDGVFYYVMELLDGLDLESLVIRDGAQPAARVIEILIQACSSLAEAHEAGLLHRDIKPPNLMLCRAADEHDIIKLLDFGIVMTPNDTLPSAPLALPDKLPETPKLTQLGAMLGTPGFMAPEQILGMQLDGRADVYALGCVAWWLLTGKEVFQREGADAKLLHRHIYDPIPSLDAKVRGWLPTELESIIESCLAKDVEKRPTDARHLAAMLKVIAIPAEHTWTEQKALAWWTAYKPPAPAPAVAPSGVELIVPAGSDVAMSPTVTAGRSG
ncbi:MAG: serine/threonine protein kinase [Deltaproteobacteria bacterium]|nr:serine/threonine protein kinase [Deltaproteobacteria bacterium]